MKRSVQLLISTALPLKHQGSIRMRSLDQVLVLVVSEDSPENFLGSSFTVMVVVEICLSEYLNLLVEAGDLALNQMVEVMTLRHLSQSVSSKPARGRKRKSPLVLLPTVLLALLQVSKREFNVNSVPLVMVQVLELLSSMVVSIWQVPVMYVLDRAAQSLMVVNVELVVA
jgi:hypothetical protein